MKSTVFIGLFLLFVMYGCNLSTPISPGELVDSHKHLEGTGNCTQCHSLGKRISSGKCLKCHQIIKQKQTEKKGYHGSRKVRKNSCIKCHSDHHGREFNIIHFDTLSFDHTLTGYQLEGSHKEQNCKSCHKKSHIQADTFLTRKITYMGLSTSCLSCHDDYHRKTLPEDCAQCHGFKKFKPASKFNHDKAKFTLNGKHRDVKCIQCHPVDTFPEYVFQHFKDIAFDNCAACHEDIHEGKFGNRCDECHVTESFRDILHPEKFNHDLTGYSLKGKHKGLACKKCHVQKATLPLPHQYCFDCHEDYHRGELTLNGKLRNCIECHSMSGFDIPNYSIEDHNRTQFKLTGSHTATACTDCHKKQNRWHFKNIGKYCADCHKNIHKNFISSNFLNSKGCEGCHFTESWHSIHGFNHNLTRFALLGKHSKVSCRECHFTEDGKQQFASLNADCLQCHKEPHNRQFEENGTTDCIRCHAFDNWKAVNFDHRNTAFPLEGGHEKVACKECHKKVKVGNVYFVEYKIKDYRCEACH